jgi:hypothetical protein
MLLVPINDNKFIPLVLQSKGLKKNTHHGIIIYRF